MICGQAVRVRPPDRAGARPYGGAWQGPIFVLTHHPEDAAPCRVVT